MPARLGKEREPNVAVITSRGGRGRDKEKLSKDLGAHAYIDAADEDAGAALRHMGGARVAMLS